jgi:glycine hydroxymethyltransferase
MLTVHDPEIFNLIDQEAQRQQTTINLIASENYTSQAVRQASASVLTNKYAEGYPGKRYYAGCRYIDQIEVMAQERCKKLFGATYANVQPHAGSLANMAAFFAVLKPGDTIMGMNLSEGGHLTHGHTVNFSGIFYRSVPYTVDRTTELIDYNALEDLTKTHKPNLIIAGASAYSRTLDFKAFRIIADNVGALLLVDMAHIAGLIAANIHPDPVPYADIITSTTHKTLRGPRGALILAKPDLGPAVDKAVMPGIQGGPFMHVIAAKAVAFKEALSDEFKQYQRQVVANAQAMATEFKTMGYRLVADGTDNHLFILDLRNKSINGRVAERTLETIGITVSRSCIPFDPEVPWITSGIRLGTPAITTRGALEEDVRHIAQLIDQALRFSNDQTHLKQLKQTVEIWCNKQKFLKDL